MLISLRCSIVKFYDTNLISEHYCAAALFLSIKATSLSDTFELLSLEALRAMQFYEQIWFQGSVLPSLWQLTINEARYPSGLEAETASLINQHTIPFREQLEERPAANLNSDTSREADNCLNWHARAHADCYIRQNNWKCIMNAQHSSATLTRPRASRDCLSVSQCTVNGNNWR